MPLAFLNREREAERTFRGSFPADFGEVIYSSHPNGSPRVVLIQDAHSNYDAQKNIAALLRWLTQEKGFSDFALEGAEGRLDFAQLTSFPAGLSKSLITDVYLRRGKLSGAEAFAILEGERARFYGLEEAKLYEANRKAFLEALSLSPPRKRGSSDFDVVMQKSLDSRFRGNDKLLTDLASLRLNRAGLAELQSLIRQKSISPSDLSRFKAPLEFYRCAEARDEVMQRVMFEILSRRKKLAVITGGFHTQALSEALSRANISHAVVIPRIEHFEEKPVYFDILQNPDSPFCIWLRQKELSSNTLNRKLAFASGLAREMARDKAAFRINPKAFSRATGANREDILVPAEFSPDHSLEILRKALAEDHAARQTLQARWGKLKSFLDSSSGLSRKEKIDALVRLGLSFRVPATVMLSVAKHLGCVTFKVCEAAANFSTAQNRFFAEFTPSGKATKILRRWAPQNDKLSPNLPAATDPFFQTELLTVFFLGAMAEGMPPKEIERAAQKNFEQLAQRHSLSLEKGEGRVSIAQSLGEFQAALRPFIARASGFVKERLEQPVAQQNLRTLFESAPDGPARLSAYLEALLAPPEPGLVSAPVLVDFDTGHASPQKNLLPPAAIAALPAQAAVSTPAADAVASRLSVREQYQEIFSQWEAAEREDEAGGNDDQLFLLAAKAIQWKEEPILPFYTSHQEIHPAKLDIPDGAEVCASTEWLLGMLARPDLEMNYEDDGQLDDYDKLRKIAEIWAKYWPRQFGALKDCIDEIVAIDEEPQICYGLIGGLPYDGNFEHDSKRILKALDDYIFTAGVYDEVETAKNLLNELVRIYVPDGENNSQSLLYAARAARFVNRIAGILENVFDNSAEKLRALKEQLLAYAPQQTSAASAPPAAIPDPMPPVSLASAKQAPPELSLEEQLAQLRRYFFSPVSDSPFAFAPYSIGDGLLGEEWIDLDFSTLAPSIRGKEDAFNGLTRVKNLILGEAQSANISIAMKLEKLEVFDVSQITLLNYQELFGILREHKNENLVVILPGNYEAGIPSTSIRASQIRAVPPSFFEELKPSQVPFVMASQWDIPSMIIADEPYIMCAFQADDSMMFEPISIDRELIDRAILNRLEIVYDGMPREGHQKEFLKAAKMIRWSQFDKMRKKLLPLPDRDLTPEQIKPSRAEVRASVEWLFRQYLIGNEKMLEQLLQLANHWCYFWPASFRPLQRVLASVIQHLNGISWPQTSQPLAAAAAPPMLGQYAIPEVAREYRALLYAFIANLPYDSDFVETANKILSNQFLYQTYANPGSSGARRKVMQALSKLLHTFVADKEGNPQSLLRIVPSLIKGEVESQTAQYKSGFLLDQLAALIKKGKPNFSKAVGLLNTHTQKLLDQWAKLQRAQPQPPNQVVATPPAQAKQAPPELSLKEQIKKVSDFAKTHKGRIQHTTSKDLFGKEWIDLTLTVKEPFLEPEDLLTLFQELTLVRSLVWKGNTNDLANIVYLKELQILDLSEVRELD
ncbi:MAG: hypothetical protein HY586_03775, partial [Candidatus Omnitrophica bacterium]|nr:hypothetical protein [Candidatus Omnitrophota bacterium]